MQSNHYSSYRITGQYEKTLIFDETYDVINIKVFAYSVVSDLPTDSKLPALRITHTEMSHNVGLPKSEHHEVKFYISKNILKYKKFWRVIKYKYCFI